MIGSINKAVNINSVNPIISENTVAAGNAPVTNPIKGYVPFGASNVLPNATYQTNIRTTLVNQEETGMYNALLSALNSVQNAQESAVYGQKLDTLLKNGKLLNDSSNNGTTTLKNLYNIITAQRAEGFNSVDVLKTTIDAIYKPSSITQTFGDIPKEVMDIMMKSPDIPDDIKKNPKVLDVKSEGSGTCAAASLEFHLAHKRPAEFARWASELTSPKQSVTQNIKMSSLSKNYMDAVWFLDAFETKPNYFDFENATLELKPDKNAYTRALIQDKFYDPGERTILDVLMQSTIMQNASQQSYDTLTDIRSGKFNSNPQGLSSDEKTFIESIVDNKEKLSLVYQNVDDNQYLTGYRCDFKKMEEHIKSAIDMGEDVIAGYTFIDGRNQITGGHEIVIMDYKQGDDGETIFICNDTDDKKEEYTEYKASELLPKIHHAGYPASLVEHETELISA